MGVWIETVLLIAFATHEKVTPRVGVWIETQGQKAKFVVHYVTPRVGVWIETICGNSTLFICMSLPAWECGLKLL